MLTLDDEQERALREWYATADRVSGWPEVTRLSRAISPLMEGRLKTTLEQVERRLTWLSTYEKDPPEIVKDDFAYDRLLEFVQSEAKRWLVDVRTALANDGKI